MTDATDNILIRIHDVLRKDEGIRGAAQAVEQLCWMVLLKTVDQGYDDFAHEVDLDKSKLWRHWYQEYALSYRDDQPLINDVLRVEILPYYANLSIPAQKQDRLSHLLKHVAQALNYVSCRIVSPFILREALTLLHKARLQDHHKLAGQFQELLDLMVRNAGQTGAFYTPRVLVQVMNRIANPLFRKYYEPAMGSGGLLVAKSLAQESDVLNSLPTFPAFHAEESNPAAYLLGLTHLVLAQVENYELSLGSPLQQFPDDVQDKQQYDLVLSNPPFGGLAQLSQLTGQNKNQLDDGLPERVEARFLWHIMQVLKQDGQAAVIMPYSFLFDRSSKMVNLRKELLFQNKLQTILCLPVGALAPYTSVKCCILYFSRGGVTQHFGFYRFPPEMRFSRNMPLTLEHFSDFFKCMEQPEKDAEHYRYVATDQLDHNAVLDIDWLNEMEALAPDRVNMALDLLNQVDDIKAQLKEINHCAKQIQKLTQEAKADTRNMQVKDLLVLRSGKLLPKKDMVSSGNIPVYGGNGIVGNHDKSNLDGEHILVGRVGANCGNVHLVDGKLWITNNVSRVIFHQPTQVYLPYMARLLEALDLGSYARGTAQVFFSFDNIKDIPLQIPNLDMQEKLAIAFAQLEQVMRQRVKAGNEEIENLGSMFKQLRGALKFNADKLIPGA